LVERKKLADLQAAQSKEEQKYKLCLPAVHAENLPSGTYSCTVAMYIHSHCCQSKGVWRIILMV
jgi:hypothetical protein